MTKQEAAVLLSVAIDATRAEVQKRFDDLHNDYQIRLTNAPTAPLKKTYQKNLQEIREAAETLHPGVGALATADFPAAEPVQSVDRSQAHKIREPIRVVRERTSVSDSDGGLPRSTIIAAGVAIVLAATAALFAVEWQQTSQQSNVLKDTAVKQNETIRLLSARIKEDDRLLEIGQLEVCNRSSMPAQIASVAAMYRDNDGRMRLVHSGSYGYPTWTLAPGSRSKIEILRGQPNDWDGSASFYALQMIYKGAEPFMVIGLWSETKDRCVNLYLD